MPDENDSHDFFFGGVVVGGVSHGVVGGGGVVVGGGLVGIVAGMGRLMENSGDVLVFWGSRRCPLGDNASFGDQRVLWGWEKQLGVMGRKGGGFRIGCKKGDTYEGNNGTQTLLHVSHSRANCYCSKFGTEYQSPPPPLESLLPQKFATNSAAAFLPNLCEF